MVPLSKRPHHELHPPSNNYPTKHFSHVWDFLGLDVSQVSAISASACVDPCITLCVVLTSAFVWAFWEAGETTDPVKK